MDRGGVHRGDRGGVHQGPWWGPPGDRGGVHRGTVVGSGAPPVSPGEEGLVVLDGVQLVGGGVAAFARQLCPGVVGAGAAGDVDVAAAQVAASFEGRRRRGDAVDDDARREKLRVLMDDERDINQCFYGFRDETDAIVSVWRIN